MDQRRVQFPLVSTHQADKGKAMEDTQTQAFNQNQEIKRQIWRQKMASHPNYSCYRESGA